MAHPHHLFPRIISLLTLLFLLLTHSTPVTAAAAAAAAETEETRSCNGQPSYCNRRYSNLTFTGAHDSPFVGALPQHNQNVDVQAQLDRGIRYLQAQTHKLPNDTIQLCHTSCILEDAGPLEKYLVTIKDWLDAHKDEVVTILLTNGDNVPVDKFDTVFDKAGIKKYAFVPESSPKVLPMESWPTLQELIDKGTRLVVFLDYGANTEKTPYILDEFAYYFETAYGITDPAFKNCSIDRPPGASSNGRMYIVNHFLDLDILGIKVPDREHASRTNAASGDGSIGAQSELCQKQHGQVPNVVLLDFIDQGEAMLAEQMLNGVK